MTNLLTFRIEELTTESNNILERFIETMLDEKQITKQQFVKMNKYRVVIIQKWFFGKLYDSVFVKEPDSVRFKFIKML